MALLAILGAVFPVIHLYGKRTVPGAVWLLAMCLVIALYPLDVLFQLGEMGVRHRFSSISLVAPVYLLAIVSYLRVQPVGWHWSKPVLMGFMLFGVLAPWLPGSWYVSFPAVQPYASINHYIYDLGSGAWAMKCASYLLICCAAFMIVQRLGSSQNSKPLLLILALVPLSVGGADLIASLTGFSPYHGVTSVQIGTTAGLFVLSYLLLRQRMLERVPVSRNLLMSHLREGMCVISNAGEVIDCNEAMGAIIGVSPNKLIGRIANRVLPEPVLVQLDEYAREGAVQATVIRFENTERTASMTIKRLEEEIGASLLIAITDVTDHSKELASVSAAADELQQENKELLELSNTDPLTGLANRRCLMEALSVDAEVDNKRKLGLLMVDVDHFKVINDTHGHAAGDAVLVRLAQAIRETCRDKDLIVRWGGEEFVVLLNDSDDQRLRLAAERLRLHIRRLAIHLQNGVTLQVTASIGASMVRAGQGPESAMRRVDRLLLEAKREGRDRVISGRPEQPS